MKFSGPDLNRRLSEIGEWKKRTMLNPFSPLELEQILRKESPAEPFPVAADRAAWQAIARKNDPKLVAKLLAEAEEAARSMALEKVLARGS